MVINWSIRCQKSYLRRLGYADFITLWKYQFGRHCFENKMYKFFLHTVRLYSYLFCELSPEFFQKPYQYPLGITKTFAIITNKLLSKACFPKMQADILTGTYLAKAHSYHIYHVYQPFGHTEQ